MSEINNMFEVASRKKVRFATSRGEFSVEELWDLALRDLDTIAKAINKQLRSTEEESFIPTSAAVTRGNSVLQLKLDIVKRVIEFKVAAAEAATSRAAKKARVAELKDLMQKKNSEALANKTPEEIAALLAEIEKGGADDADEG